jgi:TRAP transporter TAXI family solute receptor
VLQTKTGKRLIGAALVMLCAGVSLQCHEVAPRAADVTVVRLARESTLGETLAQQYAQRLPTVRIELVEAEGSVGTLQAIESNRADVGFVLGDVAYFALQREIRQPASVKRLAGMAALQPAAMHLIVRPGLNVTSVNELGRYRVGAGTALVGQTRLADLLFRVFQLGSEVLQPGPRTDLLAGVDAALATNYFPVPTVQRAMEQGATLLAIDGPLVEQLRREYPFIKRVKIPAATYPNQRQPVNTIGVDRLLVCRADLDDAVVYALTRHFMEALPALTASVRTSLRLTDLQLVPATPIPLHRGAAQYYRERELTR